MIFMGKNVTNLGNVYCIKWRIKTILVYLYYCTLKSNLKENITCLIVLRTCLINPAELYSTMLPFCVRFWSLLISQFRLLSSEPLSSFPLLFISLHLSLLLFFISPSPSLPPSLSLSLMQASRQSFLRRQKIALRNEWLAVWKYKCALVTEAENKTIAHRCRRISYE